MNGRRISLVVGGLAVVALGSAAGLAQSRGGTGTGRYTVEQAEAGSGIYAIHCAMCHGGRTCVGPPANAISAA